MNTKSWPLICTNCVNGNGSYIGETKRRKLRKKFFDESNSEDATGTTTVITARLQYIVETFYVIIDSLLVALQKRKDAYMMLDSRFGVLTQFKRMTDVERRSKNIDINLSERCGVKYHRLIYSVSSFCREGRVRSVGSTNAHIIETFEIGVDIFKH